MQSGTLVQDGQGVLHPLDQPGGSSVGFLIKAGRFEAPVVPKGRYRVELWSDKPFAPPEMEERPRIPKPPPVIKNPPQGEIEVSEDADEITIELR